MADKTFVSAAYDTEQSTTSQDPVPTNNAGWLTWTPAAETQLLIWTLDLFVADNASRVEIEFLLDDVVVATRSWEPEKDDATYGSIPVVVLHEFTGSGTHTASTAIKTFDVTVPCRVKNHRTLAIQAEASDVTGSYTGPQAYTSTDWSATPLSVTPAAGTYILIASAAVSQSTNNLQSGIRAEYDGATFGQDERTHHDQRTSEAWATVGRVTTDGVTPVRIQARTFSGTTTIEDPRIWLLDTSATWPSVQYEQNAATTLTTSETFVAHDSMTWVADDAMYLVLAGARTYVNSTAEGALAHNRLRWETGGGDDEAHRIGWQAGLANAPLGFAWVDARGAVAGTSTLTLEVAASAAGDDTVMTDSWILAAQLNEGTTAASVTADDSASLTETSTVQIVVAGAAGDDVSLSSFDVATVASSATAAITYATTRKTVGPGGEYTNIAAVLDGYKTGTITGSDITYVLLSGTHTWPAHTDTSGVTLLLGATWQPETGGTVTITPEAGDVTSHIAGCRFYAPSGTTMTWGTGRYRWTEWPTLTTPATTDQYLTWEGVMSGEWADWPDTAPTSTMRMECEHYVRAGLHTATVKNITQNSASAAGTQAQNGRSGWLMGATGYVVTGTTDRRPLRNVVMDGVYVTTGVAGDLLRVEGISEGLVVKRVDAINLFEETASANAQHERVVAASACRGSIWWEQVRCYRGYQGLVYSGPDGHNDDRDTWSPSSVTVRNIEAVALGATAMTDIAFNDADGRTSTESGYLGETDVGGAVVSVSTCEGRVEISHVSGQEASIAVGWDSTKAAYGPLTNTMDVAIVNCAVNTLERVGDTDPNGIAADDCTFEAITDLTVTQTDVTTVADIQVCFASYSATSAGVRGSDMTPVSGEAAHQNGTNSVTKFMTLPATDINGAAWATTRDRASTSSATSVAVSKDSYDPVFTVTDTGTLTTDEVTVDAGSDVFISTVNNTDETATLDGTVSGASVYRWSVIPNAAGPGTATFADRTAVDTTATFTAPGTYTVKLAAGTPVVFTGQTETHTFDHAGVYDVTLTVTDTAGQTDSITKQVSTETSEADLVELVTLASGETGMRWTGGLYTFGLASIDGGGDFSANAPDPNNYITWWVQAVTNGLSGYESWIVHQTPTGSLIWERLG